MNETMQQSEQSVTLIGCHEIANVRMTVEAVAAVSRLSRELSDARKIGKLWPIEFWLRPNSFEV